MQYNDITPIPKRMVIITGLFVVGLMAFGLALSYYKNILFDRQLIVMQQRNAKLREEVLRSYMELRYRQSAQYKDKYAKEYFNLLKPGEKVLYVRMPHQQILETPIHDRTPEEIEALYEENLRSIRVIDHWNLYIFHRDKIDALKTSAS